MAELADAADSKSHKQLRQSAHITEINKLIDMLSATRREQSGGGRWCTGEQVCN